MSEVVHVRTMNDHARETQAASLKWWQREDGSPIPRNKGGLLMPVVSEIAEAKALAERRER
jgi:hypothetical protein